MAAGDQLFEITREADAFRISGELDLSNVDRLITTLSPEVREGNELRLDCSELDFVDSTGMAALIMISRSLGDSGRLTLERVPQHVVKAAHVLGVDRLPNIDISAAPVPGIAASV